MSQSAVKAPKKAPLPRGERPVRLPPDADASSSEAIPLQLVALLSPYRSRGRLSIRIENLPQRARLSHGRNNGDNSWSLASDELDDLFFYPPEGFDDTHSLSVRILAVEADAAASTIAVIDYTVSRSERIHEHFAEEARLPAPEGASSVHDAKLTRLESELERVRAVLSAHESVLSAAEQRLGRGTLESSPHAVARELEKAKSTWDAEHDRHLAELAAEAAANLERSRSNWQAELDARLAQSEENARKELAESRERWRAEMQAALAKAERAWRSDETARFAAAEAEWRRRADLDLAASKGASSEESAARERAETELQETREKLSEALASLAERESALAQAQFEWGRDRERALQERDVAFKEAQKAWRAEEAERFAQAEARWRDESAIQLAEISMRCERAEGSLAQERAEGRGGRALADAENARDKAERTLSQLKLQISSLKNDLAEREAEIARAHEDAEAAREQAKLQSDVILERAQAAWRSEAAARLASAKAMWRQESAQSLAAARTEHDLVRTQHEAELRELQEELAEAKATIAERTADLSRSHTDSHELQERLQKELDVQLMTAQRAWKAEEAARISAAKAEWQQSATRALAEATARYQAAETALARQRAKTEDELRRGTHDDKDDEHLRHEIVLLQAALAKCEKELAVLRAAPVHQESLAALPMRSPLDPVHTRDHYPPANEDGEEDPGPSRMRGMLRDAAVIAALVVAAVLIFPFVESYLPDDWQYEIAQVTGQLPSAPTQTAIPAPRPQASPAPKPAPLPIGQVTHDANLRADASTSASIVETLDRGSQVAVLENRGDWVRVRATSSDGKSNEGWVLGSHLKVPASGANSTAAN